MEIGRDSLIVYLALCFVVGLVLGLLVVHPLVFRSGGHGIDHPFRVTAYYALNGRRAGLLVSYDGNGLTWRFIGGEAGFTVNFTGDYRVMHLGMYIKSITVDPNKDLTFTVTIKDAGGHTVAYGSRTIKALDLLSSHGLDITLQWTVSPSPEKIYEIDIGFPPEI